MTNPACSPRHILAFAALGLMLAGCSAPSPGGMNDIIEAALSQQFQVLELYTGPDLRLSRSDLAGLNTAAGAGLVSLRQTNDPGRFDVAATPKLVQIASNPNDIWTQKDQEEFTGGEPEPSDAYWQRLQRMKARVKLLDARLGKIVTNEAYSGPLATPGEKHRLVLGTFKSIPTSAVKVLGPSLATAEESLLRFRCVLRYSDFKKEWAVVACDLGSIEPERWFGDKVM
jgi:hypothetical protein